jgi:hypothetical protein
LTPSEKIALVAAATKVAKEETVAVEGIGEDIPFSLMVWREGTLIAICQLDATLSDEQPGERLLRTVEAAAACRRGYDATAFTFVTEGYCATDPDAIDDDTPLAQQFVTNVDVRECLTITHIEAGNIYLAALPYRYELGRRMAWDPTLTYEPTHAGSNHFLASMVEILITDMVEEPFIDDLDTWNDLVAEDVARWGFHIRYGMELD